jgi:hypothetical protein
VADPGHAARGVRGIGPARPGPRRRVARRGSRLSGRRRAAARPRGAPR